eukprot:GHVN01055954.1.p1 GENE.GHVN01055954.1~~GHVN01055954.1.p1  ORF type:complete len:177 (-),score=3.36 GHVN01055954.1:310-840(-)
MLQNSQCSSLNQRCSYVFENLTPVTHYFCPNCFTWEVFLTFLLGKNFDKGLGVVSQVSPPCLSLSKGASKPKQYRIHTSVYIYIYKELESESELLTNRDPPLDKLNLPTANSSEMFRKLNDFPQVDAEAVRRPQDSQATLDFESEPLEVDTEVKLFPNLHTGLNSQKSVEDVEASC